MTEPTSREVEKTLKEWRAAETAAAVARRGRVAAEHLSMAAERAAEAALATSESAKAALAAAKSAEQSAAETAIAAKSAASVAAADLRDAIAESDEADIDEIRAKADYHLAAEQMRQAHNGGHSRE